MVIYIIVLLILAIVFGGGYFAYRTAFYSPYKGRDQVPFLKGQQYDPYREQMRVLYQQLCDRPCEFVSITSRDGLTLSGRYYHIADGAPLDIAFHGYRSSALKDFSGGSMLSFDMGHNLLLVDQRAHGKSEGRTITFGIMERLDCLKWVEYALDRFGSDVKIMLYGISMGGATVLMASGLELPENVKGIIADCPYVYAKDVICLAAEKMGLPVGIGWFFVKLGAKVYGGFDIEETDAAEAVSNSKIPILILHGEADILVPCEMSDVVSCNPELIRRYTFPLAHHGISFLIDGDTYRKAVTDFVNKVLC